MMALVVAAAVATGAEARAMSCSIVTSTGVSFGSYDVFDPTPRDSVGTITYRCTGVGSDVVTIHLSQGGAPTFFPRRLTQGSYWLEYNLFLNAARTTIWGDGMGGTSTEQCGGAPHEHELRIELGRRADCAGEVFSLEATDSNGASLYAFEGEAVHCDCTIAYDPYSGQGQDLPIENCIAP